MLKYLKIIERRIGMTFKKRLGHIWYYYKFYILCGVIVLMALAVGLNSCFNRRKYDVNVLYMTHGYSDTFYQTDELCNLFDSFAEDTNGDGLANVQFITINYGTTVSESNSAYATRSANLAAGKNVLFLLDTKNYEELKNGGFLEDISNLGTSEYLIGDRYEIFNSGLLDNVSGFKQIGEQYYLCLRTYDEKKAKNDADYKAQYESAKALLTNVIDAK